ncbi:hypothetical protein SOVF_029330 [Spinacia oleracea]|nr:hypothetical protein SOVF_029330 [Spinacia oleracea]
MSWLSIPLPNPFNPFKSLQFSNDEEEEDDEEDNPGNDAVSSGVGVKEDFTAIGESIGRQFRAFISPETSNSCDGGSPSSRTFEGIRSDLEEIKGTFKSSLSLFSSNRAVSEISKLASNFLHLNDEENDVNRVNSIIEFAQQISNRPELWTEFPLSLDHEFDMSEVQYEHASTVERLVPSLAGLKSRISRDKSEKQFWMIYFILLLPRLNEEDLELLSTPDIVEARETLLMMLRAKKSDDINSDNLQSGSSSDLDNEGHETRIDNSQSVKNVTTSEDPSTSKCVEGNECSNIKKILETGDGIKFSSTDPNQSDAKHENSNVSVVTEEHGINDNGKEKEKSVTKGTSGDAPKKFQSEDDVSFSDLEDDDSDLPNRHSRSGPSQLTGSSSPEGSSDWGRLNKNVEAKVSSLRERDSEGEDSAGWLTVDDFDT